ncbi:hypothetical protein P7C70_g3467, partial [Phenoliferia sp. Uapishka_3]
MNPANGGVRTSDGDDGEIGAKVENELVRVSPQEADRQTIVWSDLDLGCLTFNSEVSDGLVGVAGGEGEQEFPNDGEEPLPALVPDWVSPDAQERVQRPYWMPSDAPENVRRLSGLSAARRGACHLCGVLEASTEVGDPVFYDEDGDAWRVSLSDTLPPGWRHINVDEGAPVKYEYHTLVVLVENYAVGVEVRSRVAWRHYFSANEMNQRATGSPAIGWEDTRDLVVLALGMKNAERKTRKFRGRFGQVGFIGPYSRRDAAYAEHLGVWGARGELGRVGIKRWTE